ncbi:SAF domain-containing protein [Arcanobacterium ihumii]|uniref:SAF domain-containing protein n=1 Tax=Arcanobacterium ihumii TaxID=2138162 RepID=UPI000F52495C|nr:SAF domain-containing protein [Arcanobacterium ihumii]
MKKPRRNHSEKPGTDKGTINFARHSRRSSPIRAVLWRWRCVVFALVIGAFVQSILTYVSSSSVTLENVVVAKTELSTGDVLDSHNLEIVQLPTKILPENTISNLDDASGQRIVAPLPKGMPVVRSQFLDSSFSSHAPPNTVITTISLADDATLAILKEGSRIDIYAPPRENSDELDAELLAKDAIVMSTISPSDRSNSLFDDFTNKSSLMVAIPNDTARLVIGIGARTPLRAVLAG